MSFMGGSACATGANPLAQMVKQQNVDRSTQYDRMQGAQGPGSLREARQMSEQDQRLLSSMDQRQQSSFRFDEMRHELGNVHHHSPGPQISVGPPSAATSNWAGDFSREAAGPGPSQWASEFHQGPSIAGPSTGPQPGASQSMSQGMSQPMRYMPSRSMYQSSMMQPAFARQPQSQAQGPQRIVELDDATWEQQFENIEKANSAEATAKDTTATKEDETAKTEEIDLEAYLEEKELGIEDGVDPKWFQSQQFPPNWDAVWDRIKDQVNDDSGEFHTRAGDIWDRDFDAFASTRPEFADYKFAEKNPYTAEEDPFGMGVALMDNGAKLSLAVLCFEAALQRNPQHVEAWSRLGHAQAQNELEDEAIRALEQCVKLDPRNEQALLSLSVSYMNEGYENAAYATLERWLATKYPELVTKATSADPNLNNENSLDLHDRVTALYLKAAQMSPDGANMDADVQVGLGVLFYGNDEYDKAVDCFRAALSVRQDDPLLWNRLGATLANSNRSEEAIDAYYKALELRPSFVRARYNVGVTCINIGCYREAAEHLLSAMSLHQTSPDGPNFEKSSNLSETLRRVFLAMDRRDLVPKVGPSMNLDEFRGEFNF